MGDEFTITGRYEWERIMRRCRLNPLTKYVGVILGQYANTDGTNAFPSVAKLARVTGLSERTVRKSLTELRSLGLIKRVQKGGMRGTQAYPDVHVLALPVDLLERVELLTPSEDEPTPNRHDVPPGEAPSGISRHPNRHVTTSQPAPDDTPTGTTCLLPIGDLPANQPSPTDDSLSETEPQEGTRDVLAELIAIDELAARRKAAAL